MDPIQRYELIRPILNTEKTPKQVHQKTKVPLSTIYWTLKRFREAGFEGLEDKSHASHSHPNWLTEEQRDKVADYKQQHPHKGSRQIAKALALEQGIQIHDRTVATILRERGLTTPFFSTKAPNSMT